MNGNGSGIPIQRLAMRTYDVTVAITIRVTAPAEPIAKQFAKGMITISGQALDAIQGCAIHAEEKMFGAEKGPRNPVRFPEIVKDDESNEKAT